MKSAFLSLREGYQPVADTPFVLQDNSVGRAGVDELTEAGHAFPVWAQVLLFVVVVGAILVSAIPAQRDWSRWKKFHGDRGIKP